MNGRASAVVREAGVSQLPSGKWRVQKTVGGRRYAGTFTTLDEANDYARAVSEAARLHHEPPTAAEWSGPSVPTPSRVCPRRINDLVRFALEERMRDKGKPDDACASDLRKWMRTAGIYLDNLAITSLNRDRVRSLRDWLQDEDGGGLAPSTTNARLALLKWSLDVAIEHGLLGANTAKDVNAIPEVPGEEVDREPLSFREAQLFAQQFPPTLRIAIWLQFILCLRIGEVFGLRLSDWDSAERVLWVRRSGGATRESTDGRGERTKTPAGRRRLPVPSVLADYIDDYIDQHHPPRPIGGGALAEWQGRSLLRSPNSENPWQVVIRSRWDRALQRAGLDQATRGYRITTHYLRKSGSSWIGLRLAGPEWSRFVGHKTAVPLGVSAVTVDDYFKLPFEHLRRVTNVLDEYIGETLHGELDPPQSWADGDYLTVVDAAQILGVPERTLRSRLALEPSLRAEVSELERERYGTRGRSDRILLTRGTVAQMLASGIAAEDFVSVSEAARFLSRSRRFVGRLIEQGHLGFTTVGAVCKISLDDLHRCRSELEVESATLGRVLNRTQASAHLGVSDAVLAFRTQQGLVETVSVMGCIEPRYREVHLDEIRRAAS